MKDIGFSVIASDDNYYHITVVKQTEEIKLLTAPNLTDLLRTICNTLQEHFGGQKSTVDNPQTPDEWEKELKNHPDKGKEEGNGV